MNKWTHPKALCSICWRRMVFVDFSRARQVCGKCEAEAAVIHEPPKAA